MLVIFTKNTPTHHTFAIRRTNGSTESAILETRSFMPHDLIHFAYESVAGCRSSFYGRLAAGLPLSAFKEMDLVRAADCADEEMIITERITGPLTVFLKGGVSNEDFIAMLQNLFEAVEDEIPAHITSDFLDQLKTRYKALIGQWAALPHHADMELQWQ